MAKYKTIVGAGNSKNILSNAQASMILRFKNAQQTGLSPQDAMAILKKKQGAPIKTRQAEPRKKAYRKRMTQRYPMAQPLPIQKPTYFPGTGVSIKTWEDRNISNIGTKLSY